MKIVMRSRAIVSAVAGAGLVQTLHAQGKPKAYAIAEIEATDAAKLKPYIDGTAVIVPQAGGRFLARGDKTLVVTGARPRPAVTVVAWESYEQAQAMRRTRAPGSRFIAVHNRPKNWSSIARRADSRATQAAIIIFAIEPWILS